MAYDPEVVLVSAILTAVVVVSLTIYAFKTKTDFTYYGGMLFIFCGVFFAAIFLNFFIQCKIFDLCIACGAAILFGIYLIFDTQLILGNNDVKMETDDYIFASMMLYIDIIQIFSQILKILGNRS